MSHHTASLRSLLAATFLVAPILTAASTLPADAEDVCVQPAPTPCLLSLGEAASASLSSPTDINAWVLHVDRAGSLSVILANLAVDYAVHVFGPDGTLVGEAMSDGADSVLVSVPEAGPGDYQIAVNSHSGEVAAQPYLLLATWQTSAPPATSPAPPATSPAPPSAASLVAAPPAAPSGLIATPLPSTQIELDWVDNANNETGFRITDDLNLPVTVEANVTSYITPPLGSGRTGCYRVQAYNDLGASAWTAPVCATVRTLPQPKQPPSTPIDERPLPPPPVPPLAPGGLRASPLNWNAIRLDWTDTSANETGFAIDGDGGFFTVRAGTTTANVGGLSPSTTYCFTVSAFNNVGEAESNQACATTLPLPTGP